MIWFGPEEMMVASVTQGRNCGYDEISSTRLKMVCSL